MGETKSGEEGCWFACESRGQPLMGRRDRKHKGSLTPHTHFLESLGSVMVLCGSMAVLTRLMWSLSLARKKDPPGSANSPAGPGNGRCVAYDIIVSPFWRIIQARGLGTLCRRKEVASGAGDRKGDQEEGCRVCRCGRDRTSKASGGLTNLKKIYTIVVRMPAEIRCVQTDLSPV